MTAWWIRLFLSISSDMKLGNDFSFFKSLKINENSSGVVFGVIYLLI